MANHKSATKKSKQDEKRRKENLSIKTGIKTVVKKVVLAVAEKNKGNVEVALANAIPAIQKAAAKGVIHKRNAARKISRLAKKLNKLS
ncbi:MAG: 30S ribosomal protein S20 [Deltaproteobacteria bacterium]